MTPVGRLGPCSRRQAAAAPMTRIPGDPHAPARRRPSPPEATARRLARRSALPLALGACDPERSLAPEAQELDSPSVAADVTPGFATTPQRIALHDRTATRSTTSSAWTRRERTSVALTSNPLPESEPGLVLRQQAGGPVRPRVSASNAPVPTSTSSTPTGATATGPGRRPVTAISLHPRAGRPTAPGWSLTMSLNGTNYVAYLILGHRAAGRVLDRVRRAAGHLGRSYTKSGQIVYVGPTIQDGVPDERRRTEHQGPVHRRHHDQPADALARRLGAPLRPAGQRVHQHRPLPPHARDRHDREDRRQPLARRVPHLVAGRESHRLQQRAVGRDADLHHDPERRVNVTRITHTDIPEGAPAWSH